MKYYNVTLKLITPVHIGNGNIISKKEYEIIGNKVNVYDSFMLYKTFGNSYENFMLYGGDKTLTGFFRDNTNVNKQKAIKYTLACGTDVRTSDGIVEFIKDPHGCPYIPGSSLKGAIRTAIMGAKLLNNKSNEYNKFRTPFAKAKEIEAQMFGGINNDVFRYIRISDSLPLKISDLVVVKRLDIRKDGSEPKSQLNVAREALKPNTIVKFKLSIDQNVFTGDQILNAIKEYFINYEDHYLAKFTFNPPIYPPDNTIYIGGGVGFASKTVNYCLYKTHDVAVKNISSLLAKKFSPSKPDMHKHLKDVSHGVSPHILKCTSYNGQEMEMGACEISIDEYKAI